VFIKFYGKLASVLSVATLYPHFVDKKLLNATDVEELHAISASIKKAAYVLRKISSSLQAGQTESFYIFLTIIQDHGNAASIQAVSEIKTEIESLKGKMLSYVGQIFFEYHQTYGSKSCGPRSQQTTPMS